jgi:hypothetical protein
MLTRHHHLRPVVSAALAGSLSTTARAARGCPARAIVVCDGLPSGDPACRLAQRFAARGAVVRAVALLPTEMLTHIADVGEPGPIERFLTDVDAQLDRTTPMPAAWRLELVVHELQGELRRVLTEFGAEVIIFPTSLADQEGVLRAVSAAADAARPSSRVGTPLLCVVGIDGAARARPAAASRRADTRTLAPLAAGEPIRSMS